MNYKTQEDIENKIDYLIGQLQGSQTDVLIKDELKSFILSDKQALLDLIEEWAENQKKKMKDIHICGFNDRESDCKCYLESISDLQAFIKSLTK